VEGEACAPITPNPGYATACTVLHKQLCVLECCFFVRHLFKLNYVPVNYINLYEAVALETKHFYLAHCNNHRQYTVGSTVFCGYVERSEEDRFYLPEN